MAILYIKNMVCDRCKSAVKKELEKHRIEYSSLELGEVGMKELPSRNSLQSFSSSLQELGFELLEDKSARTVNQIKKTIIGWVRDEESKNKRLKFSSYLSETLHKDYGSLSNLFSTIEGTTIEHYLILQKIERVKELLVYAELSLGEIADQLSYSSVQHLSNQFKKITGLTPGYFKKIGAEKRVPLDKV
ncbi:MAG: AraC family transcriptional regulator [Cyclobacteriaceae bacterium]|nr:AraC family transcriptional regulator [Cyclobacteriaceae bacterium]